MYIAQINGFTLTALNSSDLQQKWNNLKVNFDHLLKGGVLKIYAAKGSLECCSIINHTPIKTLRYEV